MEEPPRTPQLGTVAPSKSAGIRPRQVGKDRPAPPTRAEIVALAKSPLRPVPELLPTDTPADQRRDKEALQDLWGWNGYRQAVAHFVRPELRSAIETLGALEALVGVEGEHGRTDIELGEVTIAVLAGLSQVSASLTKNAEELTLVLTTSLPPEPKRKKA